MFFSQHLSVALQQRECGLLSEHHNQPTKHHCCHYILPSFNNDQCLQTSCWWKIQTITTDICKASSVSMKLRSISHYVDSTGTLLIHNYRKQGEFSDDTKEY